MRPLMRPGRLAAMLLIAAVTACSSDPHPRTSQTGASPTAGTARPSPSAAPGVTTVTAAASVTGTVRPAASPSAAPAASPPPPSARVDGTVSPLNFGSTEPVTLKANPDPAPGTAILTDVRIGVHPEEGGWDRIVFEFRDTLPAGSIAYATSAAACGSGAPVTLPGTAILTARFAQTAAHDDAGRVTVPRTTLAGPGATVLQARQTCDFEGVVIWAIGVAGTQRFKVTSLSAPPRLVIDIKQ